MSGLVWFLLIYYGGRAVWRRYKNNPHLTQALPAPALRALTLLRRPLAIYHTYYAALLLLLGISILIGAAGLLIGSLIGGMGGGVVAAIPLFFLGRWLLRLGRRIGAEELAVLRGQESHAADVAAIPSATAHHTPAHHAATHPLPAHTLPPKHTPPHTPSQQRVQGTLGAARAPQSPTLHKKKQDKQFQQL